MKIGIITSHCAPNYGAVLQTFALQEYLKKNFNADIRVVNYLPPYLNEGWSNYKKPKDIKDYLLNLYIFLNPVVRNGMKKRKNKIKEFIKNKLQLSEACYTEDELVNLNYNIYICGSDQIWNMTRRQDPNYFLYFTRNMSETKAIAYAPSIADDIPKQYLNVFREYVNNVDYISVREAVDVKQVQAVTEKPVIDVCDPVFLLGKDWWLEKLNTIPKHKDGYILCYFLSTTPHAVNTVKKIKEITGLKIVHININATDHFDSDENIRDASPLDFLAYIRDAKYVCTNSFHCTAFSVMFEKNLIVVSKPNSNRRMENIFKQLGMDSLFISEKALENLTEDQLIVDYSASREKYREWRERSKDYLREAIISED